MPGFRAIPKAMLMIKDRPSDKLKGGALKIVICMIVAAYLASGCVVGSTIPHEDSPGATKRDEGPALCRDTTTPPCNDRD